MVALAKDKQTYPGLTFKALIYRLIAKDKLTTITQISAVLKKNFPRSVEGKAVAKLPKRIASLLRKLHRGKLVVEEVERKNCPPPTEPITIKGVEYVPPKPKVKREPKATKTEKPAKAKTKAQLKEEIKALTTKIKKKPAAKKKAKEDDGVEEVE